MVLKQLGNCVLLISYVHIHRSDKRVLTLGSSDMLNGGHAGITYVYG
jgi:hypothetical protein